MKKQLLTWKNTRTQVFVRDIGGTLSCQGVIVDCDEVGFVLECRYSNVVDYFCFPYNSVAVTTRMISNN